MDRPTILAIAGGTASGKTTLTKIVVAAFGAAHITHDRYYKTVDRTVANHPDRVLLHNYDHPDALDTDLLVKHLTDLRDGHPVVIPDYDFADSARRSPGHWTTVQPRRLIVVEGILILSDERLRPMFDHKVFVDTPDDIRLARRMKRDIVERGQAPREVIEQYLSTVRPMHEQYVAPSKAYADLVVDGTVPVEVTAMRILGLVRRRS